MSQTKEKSDSFVLSRSELWLVWRCHGIPRVCCYCFCLEPTVRKDTWMRTTSVTVMAFFPKVAFWKLLDHSYVQSSFSINTRHIENSILKDTLQLNIFRTWINLRATSFIKTSVNMKKKLKTVPRKRSACTFPLFYTLLFLSNLVFKFHIVLIGNFWIFVTTNLFTFLLFV